MESLHLRCATFRACQCTLLVHTWSVEVPLLPLTSQHPFPGRPSLFRLGKGIFLENPSGPKWRSPCCTWVLFLDVCSISTLHGTYQYYRSAATDLATFSTNCSMSPSSLSKKRCKGRPRFSWLYSPLGPLRNNRRCWKLNIHPYQLMIASNFHLVNENKRIERGKSI